jgi:hypothetical protein
MFRLKIECKCGIEKVFECLQKLEEKFEYKVWEYNNNAHLLLKVRSKKGLEEILKKLRENCEFRLLIIDYFLPWWTKWKLILSF